MKGKVVFAIKIYRPSEEFPEGGLFSQYLEEHVNVGDYIMVEGPFGLIKYHGYGEFSYKRKKLQPKKTKIGLIAGGTGITQVLSIAQASSLAKDGIEITFLISNKTKDDILCQD